MREARQRFSRNLSPAPAEASPPPALPAGRASEQTETLPTIDIEVLCGSQSQVDADVAVVARYRGLPFAGSAIEFDYLLKSWLTRPLEMGMIGSGLGEVFPIPVTNVHKERNLHFDEILLVGMGEPGYFGADDLHYLMTNVTVVVKSQRKQSFSTTLIGARRNELSVGGAARGFLDGVLDGYGAARASSRAWRRTSAVREGVFRGRADPARGERRSESEGNHGSIPAAPTRSPRRREGAAPRLQRRATPCPS